MRWLLSSSRYLEVWTQHLAASLERSVSASRWFLDFCETNRVTPELSQTANWISLWYVWHQGGKKKNPERWNWFVCVEQRERAPLLPSFLLTLNSNDVSIIAELYPSRGLLLKDFLALRNLICSSAALFSFHCQIFLSPSWLSSPNWRTSVPRLNKAYFIATVILFVEYSTLMCLWATSSSFNIM